MTKTNWLKFKNLVTKDLRIVKNRFQSILVMVIFYLLMNFYVLHKIKTVILSGGPDMVFIFINLFAVQVIYIMASMLLPLLIYTESIKEKHEIYFAYGYSIFEIVFGKTFVLGLLSLVPAYFAILLFFFSGITLSLIFILDFVLIIPILSLGIIAFNILLTWFSKVGKISSAVFLVGVIFSLSQVHNIIGVSIKITNVNVVILFAGLLLSAILWGAVGLFSLLIKKEKCILKYG
ncbi:MAG: hypothetical protein ACM3SY_21700 [Candidatus Omnitrophota bacterium]